jgi:pyruvate dehydrogenase E2 component (dihydrolipoamide acetyltransferase)
VYSELVGFIQNLEGFFVLVLNQVIAIMVEDEDDIAKLRDYTPSGQGATIDKNPSKEASPPPPPLKEETPSPVVTPKTEKSATSLETEDRIFASLIARKMAEDHKVSFVLVIGILLVIVLLS